MRRHGLQAFIYLGLAAVGLAGPPSALAGNTNVKLGQHSGDGSALTLSGSRMRTLSHRHVVLRATRPATHPGTRFYFPQSSGTWNFTKATGSLTYSGSVRVLDKKRSVPLAAITFTRTASGKSSVSAKTGRRKFNLFTLTGRARILKQGTRETINGLTAHLTSAAAGLVNAALHQRVVTRNENMGSFVVTVTDTTKTSPGGTAGSSGSGAASAGAQLSVAHIFRQTLNQFGLSPAPILPASGGLPGPAGTTTIPGADGTSITLPAATGPGASASFNDGTLTGSIPLSGGIQLGTGTGSISLTNPVLSLGTGTEGSGLTFSVDGGPAVKLFAIDTSALVQSATNDGTISLSGLTATLSSQGATTLNKLAGRQIVKPAQTVGGLTVIVPSSPSGTS